MKNTHGRGLCVIFRLKLTHVLNAVDETRYLIINNYY